MGETYGAFTLERDDLVALAQRIVLSVPNDFLYDKENPLIISVDGTFKGGKKIIPDSGYEAAFNIQREDLSFAQGEIHDGTDWKRSFSEAGKDLNVIYRGRGEYDEYVIGRKAGRDVELSFVNVAWGQGFSFKAAPTECERLAQHLGLRQKGGIVFVHNAEREYIAPDINIRIESDYGDRHVNGENRVCPDVVRILGKGLGTKQAYDQYDWARYVEVSCHNEALDRAASISKMLTDEFGFTAKSQMPKGLFDLGGGTVRCAEDVLTFPLLDKYRAHLRAYADVVKTQRPGEPSCYEIKIDMPVSGCLKGLNHG
ncbi:MAG: hypothetical protein CL561_03020 [Alphaproteobacteria bacterium]|nr:hypothetical protein [Alphaproteobacteria bacterium]|tara:strand:- start:822 stop:1760 length:939 start_codon:yes stop_codon:yes gene_type:complete